MHDINGHGRSLTGYGSASDDGTADPLLAAALQAMAAGTGGEHDVLLALAGTRLLVPVVALAPDPADPAGPAAGGLAAGGTGRGTAVGDDVGDGSTAGPGAVLTKDGEMALPTIVGPDGRTAVPAFTCIAALSGWRADARPVPVPAAAVCVAALDEGAAAVVVDIAGPVTYPVEGARLVALAGGDEPSPPHRDPDVLAAVYRAASAEPDVARTAVRPADADADFTVHVDLHPDADAAAIAARIEQRLAPTLAGRLPRGIVFTAKPA